MPSGEGKEEAVMIRTMVIKQVATMNGDRLMIHICGDRSVQPVLGMLELAKHQVLVDYEKDGEL